MLDTIITLTQNGLQSTDTALLVNRVVLGTFFALSGYHKLTNKDRHATLVKTLEASHVPAIRVNQWFVPGVEFFCGLALISGILAPLAALGLLAICMVATCTDGLKRIAAWSPVDRGDYLDDVLYLPEVLYLAGLIGVIFMGPGAFTILAHPGILGAGILYVATLYVLCRHKNHREA